MNQESGAEKKENRSEGLFRRNGKAFTKAESSSTTTNQLKKSENNAIPVGIGQKAEKKDGQRRRMAAPENANQPCVECRAYAPEEETG